MSWYSRIRASRLLLYLLLTAHWLLRNACIIKQYHNQRCAVWLNIITGVLPQDCRLSAKDHHTVVMINSTTLCTILLLYNKCYLGLVDSRSFSMRPPVVQQPAMTFSGIILDSTLETSVWSYNRFNFAIQLQVLFMSPGNKTPTSTQWTTQISITEWALLYVKRLLKCVPNQDQHNNNQLLLHDVGYGRK